MDEHGWRGQGSPNQPDTGIAQVLGYYARYGGELLGARRSDNPLTLTHVRWHDQSGHVLDASHLPEMDGDIDTAEREVWVQLALDLPIAAAGMYGARAPWEHLALNQGRAAELLNQLHRSLSSRTSGNSNNPARWSQGYAAPQAPANQAYGPQNPGFNGGWNANQAATPGGPFSPPQSLYPPPVAQQPPAPSQQPFPPYGGQPPQSGGMSGTPFGPGFAPRPNGEPQMAGAPGMSADTAREWTNSMRSPQEPEVTVIPCIEVELPPVLTDPAASDQARDFTRDVARHFNRSARQLQQVRETRGWMRNGRMVLAARMALAPGSRVPSHTEMENAARLLADALVRNMLPYTRMTFAEPGEWTQGVSLPE
ncbi:MAG: hypothetical protein ACM3N4_12425 [Nitrososphaerota archaeon]